MTSVSDLKLFNTAIELWIEASEQYILLSCLEEKVFRLLSVAHASFKRRYFEYVSQIDKAAHAEDIQKGRLAFHSSVREMAEYILQEDVFSIYQISERDTTARPVAISAVYQSMAHKAQEAASRDFYSNPIAQLAPPVDPLYCLKIMHHEHFLVSESLADAICESSAILRSLGAGPGLLDGAVRKIVTIREPAQIPLDFSRPTLKDFVIVHNPEVESMYLGIVSDKLLNGDLVSYGIALADGKHLGYFPRCHLIKIPEHVFSYLVDQGEAAYSPSYHQREVQLSALAGQVHLLSKTN